MKWKIFFLLFILFFQMVSAVCDRDQIDINSASISELDNIVQVGLTRAQSIVDERPFNSVEDLLKVHGIGEATLKKIKNQGLACVVKEEEKKENKEDVKISKKMFKIKENMTFVKNKSTSESIININSEEKLEKIVYESKKERINKNLLSGFIVFFIGLIYLLIRK